MCLLYLIVEYISTNGPFQGHTFYSERINFIMSNCICLGFDMTCGLILLVNLGMV